MGIAGGLFTGRHTVNMMSAATVPTHIFTNDAATGGTPLAHGQGATAILGGPRRSDRKTQDEELREWGHRQLVQGSRGGQSRGSGLKPREQSAVERTQVARRREERSAGRPNSNGLF